jgi:hypothetical protein
MKGICFTFDAFGQWCEHERSKMCVKNEIGSRVEAKCGRSAKDLWPAGHLPPLFLFFPFYYIPLYLNHHTLGTNWRAFGHMGWPPDHLSWPTGHTLAPLKKGYQGEPCPSSHKLKSIANFLNPSPSSLFLNFRVLVFRVESRKFSC